MAKSDGSAFREHDKSDGSGKTDIWFNNGPEDGDNHGHVTQSTDDNGDRTYHFVRDNNGDVYVNDSK